MKKLLLILLALQVNAFSQTNIVTGYFTSADTVYRGQSAWIEIYYSYGMPLNANTDSVIVQISGGLQILNTLCYSQLDTMPKYSTTQGMLTRIPLVIPSNASLGNQNYIIGCQSCFSGGHTLPVYVKAATGIQNYILNEEIVHKEYFNLIGEPVSPPTGIVVELTTYKSGAKSYRKIIQ